MNLLVRIYFACALPLRFQINTMSNNMNNENLIEDVNDESNCDHHPRRTPVLDQGATTIEIRYLTKKLTNEYIVLVDKVKGLD